MSSVVVLGGGPGGYSAAFRLADLGHEVTLIDQEPTLGGVCLNVGCIPSKAYLHIAEIIFEAKEMSGHGVVFGQPDIDPNAIVAFKNRVIGQLTQGLSALAKKRKVRVIQAHATFKDDRHLTLTTPDGKTEVLDFEQCIIATGSRPVKLGFLPDDERIIDSTGALELPCISGHMLVIGGGIIGCEMATIYRALGMEVTIVELMDQIMPGSDKDMSGACQKVMTRRGVHFMLETKVESAQANEQGIEVSFQGKHAPEKPVTFDLVLSAVGRRPNGDLLNIQASGIQTNAQGFIDVDRQMRTSKPHIYAIGDICGNPMLAHKAVPQGRLVAQVIDGKKDHFDARCIPSVAYTLPEVAWVGFTEQELNAQNRPYEKGVFPWMACGRAIGSGQQDGSTKVLSCPKTHQILGAAMTGHGAGDMISQMAHAIEMGSTVEDIALTIHAHPTYAETWMLACEIIEGSITDLYMPKRKT